MASAPTPGTIRQQPTAHYRLRIRDEVLEVPREVTIGEKFAVRAATGMPLDAFFAGDRFGEDSICVMWWLAQRSNGHPNMSWAEHLKSWPTNLSLDDMELVLVTDESDDSDDPGKSEPA